MDHVLYQRVTLVDFSDASAFQSNSLEMNGAYVMMFFTPAVHLPQLSEGICK